MYKKREARRPALWKCISLALMTAASGAVWAQEETDDSEDAVALDRVAVTGSRITRSQVEGPSPVIVMSAEDIEREGFTTVYEALNTLTQNVSNTQDDQFSGGFTQNANTIDLRGLGPGRTLILVNGRRTTDYPLPFNGQSNLVNLASIPVAAVDRIEVLAGGASAIYGSDAVAGVINIVMKTRVDGVDVRLRVGDTTEGGGESERLQIVGGIDTNRVNFVYALEYFNREPIWAFERDYMDTIEDDPDGPPFTNTRSLLALDNFDPFRVGSTGFRYIDPTPATCDNWDRLEHSFRVGAGNFCGRNDDISRATIRNGNESYSGYFNLEVELTDRMQAYGYLNYIDKESEFNVGSLFWQSNRFGPNIDGANYYSNLDNIVQYDLSPFGIGVIEWPQVTLLQRIFTEEEMGGKDYNNNFFDETSMDLSVGLRGDFATTWSWDFNLSHSEYDLKRTRRLVMADAADTFFAGGSLANLDPDPLFGGFFANLGDLTDPGNPYNNPLTPAQFASITGDDVTRADSSNTTASLTLVGDLFDLPAGTVSMASVFEWGTQEYDINLSDELVNGDFWGFTGTGGGGSRDRYAAGVEFLIPVFNSVTATAAARYDKYDDITDVDDAVTYALGLEYRPTQNLLLRGRYATSFRAPDMHYVFADPSGFFTTLPDYYLCAKDLGVDESSPGGLTACIDPIRGDLSANSIAGTRQGNPGLEEEEGESYTIGFVWDILNNLSITVDYYDIHLENIVQDRNTRTMLLDERACRLGSPYTVTPGTDCNDLMNRITRNPIDGGVNSETLVSIITGPFNQAVQETNGIDATLRYTQPTEKAGLFTVQLGYTNVIDQKAATLPTDPVVSYANSGTQDLRSRLRATFGWSYKKLDAVLFANYLGSTLTADSLASDTLTRIDPETYWNATFKYNFTDNFSATVIGNNIFNKEPPLTNEEEWPYFNIFVYDPYGREVFLELAYLFN